MTSGHYAGKMEASNRQLPTGEYHDLQDHSRHH